MCRYGPKSQVLGLQRPLDERVSVCVESADFRLEGSVRDDLPAYRAAEQLMAWLPQRLAAEVVESDVEGSEGVDHRAAPAVHRRADVELVPQALDVSGSSPISISLNPRPIVCVPGASMQARPIHGLTSLSPTPVIPSSV
jgi:hypothetical protein